ncbi:MAG: DMT family transporter [Candidatus Brennerbacteria bacterium]
MTGIFFALGALFAWGFGDFFIQRSSRAVGIWKALFFIGVAGIVTIFPFIIGELDDLFGSPKHLALLSLAGIVVLFTALFEFESLRRGKLAIVEPVLGFELVITVGLSTLIWGENITLVQLLLALATLIGIVLAVTEHHTHLHYHRRIRIEKGVVFAGLGAIGMGLFNFLVGVGSQETSPLLTVWFTNLLFTAVCLVYLARHHKLRELVADIRAHTVPILGVCVLDNLAWISFAVATTYIPIAIATTISESYIVLAVLLGVFMNKERLKWHQVVGVVVTIASVIFLSAISS